MNALTPFFPRTYGNGDGRSSGTAPTPFASFHREMDQLLDDVWNGFGFTRSHVKSAAWPAVEVHEHENEFVVTADLPGLDPKDIELSFHDGALTLKGQRRSEENTRLYSERWVGAFEREISIGNDVDADKIGAAFRNGVITVTLPKKPDRLPRRIEVNTASG